MRRVKPEPDLFRHVGLPHKRARELDRIDRILEANPSIDQAVWEDLQGPLKVRRGRPGLAASVVLRAAILKQMHGYSYEDLAFHLADSLTYRRFCGLLDPQEAPSRSALASSIKRISSETWEKINRILLDYARDEGIEDGKKVRVDPTVTETPIHPPTDNTLLFDCVRVLGRLLGQAQKGYGVVYSSRVKRAKRRCLQIMNAATNKARRGPYEDLLKVTGQTISYAEAAIVVLSQQDALQAQRLAVELARYVPLAERVVAQTRRRVIDGESVPASEKIVSIFEPHTAIIRKDRRQTYRRCTSPNGHKVTLTGGESGLILDWVVEEGNPPDSTLLIRMLDRLKAIFPCR